jgi:chaperonin cofactor prefoldin
VNLEFIGKQLAGLREDVKAVKDDLVSFKETIEARLDRIEHSQNRFRVRIALMETRDRDLAGDLAAIARIIERAGLLEEGRD